MAARKRAPQADADKVQPAAQSLGKADAMRSKLAQQEKVAILIPLTPGEKEGATETVILNGHRVNITKGVYVHVPKQVAKVIMESQQMTQAAIDNYFLMNAEGKSKAMRAKELNSDNQ